MKSKFKISPPQALALGFLITILFGTLLLSLPFASTQGSTSFVDALFTATSATCVTGLVTLTTAVHWTLFGKIVILILIQIGGIGFMTFISLSAIIAKKTISLNKRKLLMQSSGSLELRGLVSLLKRILLGTFIVEAIGALLLAIRLWCIGFSFSSGLWNGVFHSISAFCNAGFDVLGSNSLEGFKSDPFVLLTISALIIIGGIGFLVWGDLSRHGIRLKKFSLHSKLALYTTAILIFGGAILLYFTERGGAFAELNEGEKWLNALFQSVTLRTAGFASVNQAELSSGGTIASCVFMLIGGSPGSTAGGIKTVTFAVIILNTLSLAKGKDSVTVFKKRIHEDVIKQAGAILGLYLAIATIMVVVISMIEPSMEIEDVIFEVFSAIATVGLSRGITPYLSIASKILITFTMYFGRLGGLTLLTALSNARPTPKAERPYEKILIG